MTTTPGPWALRGSQIRAENGTGAHVATYQISRDDGLLIAAAPKLLDALEHLLLCQPQPMAPFGKLYVACEAARAAIAAAKGSMPWTCTCDDTEIRPGCPVHDKGDR